MHEILKLLHELLPEVSRDKKEEILSSTERILLDQPHILQEFGLDILPTLVQVGLFICWHIACHFIPPLLTPVLS